MDVPDRLPYELADRVWEGQPRLRREHEVQPVHVVMATKLGTQTLRPFVRPHVGDMLLFQALIDRLRGPIEAALPNRDNVFSYRLARTTADDPFAGTPQWRDFHEASSLGVAENPGTYVVRGDLSSFFLTVDLSRLRTDLLDIGGDAAPVRDLHDLLQEWRRQGVRGLPQGLPPSGPLANIYLLPVDRILTEGAIAYWRYSDDFLALTESYSAARQLLDALERELYARGMSLGSGKTSIKRAETVLSELETAEEQLDDAVQSMVDLAGLDYGPSEDEIEGARLDLVKQSFDDSISQLRLDIYPRHELIAALRHLAKARDPHAVGGVPYVMLRMPGLTSECMRYFTKLRAPDAPAVADALTEIVGMSFHRDQEWVHILRAAIRVAHQRLAGSADRFAELALTHRSPLVRARALLAWGRHAEEDEAGTAEAFFEHEAQMWRGYAIAAMNGRSEAAREELYAYWGIENRSVRRLIEALDERPVRWAHM